MTPNVIYLLIDKPWRARIILRAYRVYRARRRVDATEHRQWSARLAAETLVEQNCPELDPWIRALLIDHATDARLYNRPSKIIVAPGQFIVHMPRQW